MNGNSGISGLLQHLSRKRRWQLGLLIILMLLGALAEMATLGAVVPFLALLANPDAIEKYPTLKGVFEHAGGTTNNFLLLAGIVFAIVAVAAAAVRTLMMWVGMRFSYGLGADLGKAVYARTLYRPYSWHASKNSSEILAGIDKVNWVIDGVLTPLTQSAVAIAMTVGILAMLLAIDTTTALIAGVGFSFFYGATTLVLRRRLAQNGKIISENLVRRVQAIQEGLGGIRDVLLDGSQAIYVRRFEQYDYQTRLAQASNAVIGASPRYIIEAAGMVLIIGLAYWLKPEHGAISTAVPVLGALAIGAQKLLPQMQLVYAGWSSIKGNRQRLEDVLELLNESTPQLSNYTVEDIKTNNITNKKTPLLALKNITFAYGKNDNPVLQNISFEIYEGDKIGFIGQTGSGKSTLIDIIMGLLEPTSGDIEVNGKKLSDSQIREEWQRKIAHVPQTIYLTDATIAENIALGKSKNQIDQKRLQEVSNQAQISEFVEKLPDKLLTKIGERGVKLSGGQRQRIGLARALYKNSNILILDEATSALDNKTEKKIINTLINETKISAILMIAHKLSTLEECNKICEIKSNKLIVHTKT